MIVDNEHQKISDKFIDYPLSTDGNEDKNANAKVDIAKIAKAKDADAKDANANDAAKDADAKDANAKDTNITDANANALDVNIYGINRNIRDNENLEPDLTDYNDS